MSDLHKKSIRISIVTVSDTRTRENDDAGRVCGELLKEAGHTLVRHVIIKDDPENIKELVRDMSDANVCDAIICNGGTGITKRDNTHEALEAIFEKRIDGFGEAFRRISWDDFGPRAILTRATAGVFNSCVVFSLPGSPNAVRLGMTKLILPVLQHAVDLAQGRTTHRSTLA
ncbi:MAG TPA: molybdenum cofactor biosynthesis protein B [Polyangiaceae bacterium]|jgi:molybdenum cofactor biosynthesis protein B